MRIRIYIDRNRSTDDITDLFVSIFHIESMKYLKYVNILNLF